MTYLSSFDYELIADALDTLDPDGSEATNRKSELEAWARAMAASGTGYLPAAEPGRTAPPIRCLISIEGGLVSSFIADRPGLELTVIDYDTEGAEEEDLFDIPQDGGKTADAFRSEHDGEVSPDFIEAALAARPTNPEARLEMLRHYAEKNKGEAWGEACAREADKLAAMLASEPAA